VALTLVDLQNQVSPEMVDLELEKLTVVEVHEGERFYIQMPFVMRKCSSELLNQSKGSRY
jgi:hypothetical protein